MTVDAPTPPSPPRRSRRTLRTVLLVVGVPLAVVALGLLALRLFQPHLYAGTVMQAPEPAPAMTGLEIAGGDPVDLDAYAGDVVLVYFGYTHCPDVCPTTLSAISKAFDRMDADPDRVHVLMLTVDPARDDAATLDTYVRSFDDRFRGVTGEVADIERVASLYGVYFARGDDMAGGGYAMDHTATLMGIDTSGHLRIVWPNGVTPSDLAADLDALL